MWLFLLTSYFFPLISVLVIPLSLVTAMFPICGSTEKVFDIALLKVKLIHSQKARKKLEYLFWLHSDSEVFSVFPVCKISADRALGS